MAKLGGMRVVVLGGSGFVGGAITRALTQAGFDAVAAQRRPQAGPGRQIVCDATDPVRLRHVLRHAGGVVNAVLGDDVTMLKATRYACVAARELGIRHVYISSMAVYGPARGLVKESATLLGTSRYARAKIGCEKIMGADTVILRPGIVYGPGSEQWVGRIGRLLRAGRLGDLGPNGDGRCNAIHARDVGAAVVASFRRSSAVGNIFNLASVAPPRWNDVFVAFGRAIGAVPIARIGARRLDIESRVLAPIFQAGRASRLLPKLPAPVSASLLALLRQDITLDHSEADRVLGFPRTPDADGLCESAAWFRLTYGTRMR